MDIDLQLLLGAVDEKWALWDTSGATEALGTPKTMLRAAVNHSGLTAKALVFLMTLVAAGCSAPSGGGATRIDEVPMYGGMNRLVVPELKAGDERFIADVTAHYGSREAASRKWVDQGFAFYRQDNLAFAMRRFNQAWLLDPGNPEVYWGFASVLNDQQKYCDATSMIDKAFSLGPIQPGFLPDAAITYVGCATQNPTLPAERKASLLARSEELFAQAYASPAVRKEYTLFHWARAMYARGDYANAWAKVADYRRDTGKEFPEDFVRNLSAKMPEPR